MGVWVQSALSQMRTSAFCPLIIDLHSHLRRWCKFSSFQEKNADHTVLLLNPPGQGTFIPFFWGKTFVSVCVREEEKKGKIKVGLLRSRISRRAVVLESFTNASCSKSVSTELSVLRQDDSKWVDSPPYECNIHLYTCAPTCIPLDNSTWPR